MTVKELLDQIELESFEFEFDDEFTPANALIAASPEIANIVNAHDDMDFDELFDTVFGFVWDRDTTFEDLRAEYSIDDDILYANLAVTSIYVGNSGILVLAVTDPYKE